MQHVSWVAASFCWGLQSTALATKHDVQTHFSFSPMTANISAACRKCCVCHMDEKVSDVLQLSNETASWTSKCRENATLAAQNGHNSKNQHGALVKRDLRKRASRGPLFMRACAVETHMGISQRNFHANIYNYKLLDHRACPDLTPAF
jgi:hypothetical protein